MVSKTELLCEMISQLIEDNAPGHSAGHLQYSYQSGNGGIGHVINQNGAGVNANQRASYVCE